MATESQASLQYELPRQAEGYRLMISSEGRDGTATAGNFRLLMGLNVPEVLEGEAEPIGWELIRQPIPARIGIKLQQITAVDQKAENFGVVATLILHWRDPELAFDPEAVQDRFQIFEGDAFSAEMSRRGHKWPQYTVVNQQGNRRVQNRLVIVRPDSDAAYLERFSTTVQAPHFDFRDFPFDEQKFFIRIDLLAPEWMFSLEEIEGYSEVGEKLGEEEWVVTDFATSFDRGAIFQRPVSRFDFELHAKRHLDYYFFRILLPLTVIISVSWILFFLRQPTRRLHLDSLAIGGRARCSSRRWFCCCSCGQGCVKRRRRMLPRQALSRQASLRQRSPRSKPLQEWRRKPRRSWLSCTARRSAT
jgi:hypothetical protein